MRHQLGSGLRRGALLGVLALLVAGCGAESPASDAAMPKRDEPAVEQVGGGTPQEALSLLNDAFLAGDCPRVRELWLGAWMEPDLCEGVADRPDPRNGDPIPEPTNIEEAGPAALAWFDGVDEASLLADTEVGWLLVGGNVSMKQVPQAIGGGEGATAADAVREWVDAWRAGDCAALARLHPTEQTEGADLCGEGDDVALDNLEQTQDDGYLAGFAVTVFTGDSDSSTVEMRLVRTTEDRWVITGYSEQGAG